MSQKVGIGSFIWSKGAQEIHEIIQFFEGRSLFKPKFLKKEEIEQLIQGSITDEELAACKNNHVLSPPHHEIITGCASPGSVYFKTRDGREILDCTAQAWVLNLGMANPDVNYAAALQAQLTNHTWSYYLTPIRVKLCNKIAEIAPGQLKGGRVAINNSGGGASLECAIKLVQANKKWGEQFLIFWRGYHGTSLAMTGASQRLPVRFRAFGEDRWVRAPYPYCYRCPWGYKDGLCGSRDPACQLECLDLVSQTMKYFASGFPIGCIIEPMLGPGGMVPAPVDFLMGLKQLCKDNQMMLIYDEAQTGFGRTGKMFASDWYLDNCGKDVSPDVMTLTKAAAGGYPIGIVVAKNNVKPLSEIEELTTFASPPVSMAAALVNIEILQKCGILENAAKQGAKLTKFFKELQGRYPQIGDVRGPGLFIGVELVKEPKTRVPFNDLVEKLLEKAWENNLYIGESMPALERSGEMIRNVVKIKPPLVITDEDTAKICELFEKSLKEALAELK